ncbi:succinylglutamate desuccinylase/aspartoacylase family protein [Pseudomonas sp. Marseille-P9899]|uniref:succinylglutamate desuccinylase/aspartoacylase family protein n=1 Tax=Pseudomonas sp. Marseille-P9899 TaxID=2730401 RepID=UPI00158BCAF1|nr:succinylglutamate desuccinylase/aspartoacylase family protein [Pseudomonas sp. Marseille-P9899]
MPTSEAIRLPSLTPGTEHRLLKHRFGSGGRSAYIQAGLHADEHPGLLVIQHLLSRLVALEAEGRLDGTIVIVPFANPVGLGQQVFGQMPGRYNLANGENFNRNFPDITGSLEQAIDQCALEKNDVAVFKTLFAAAMDMPPPLEAVQANKYWLLQEALNHDILIDLHCDTSSILHIYANHDQRQRALDLAAATGVEAVFLEDEAGGFPLDEAYAKAWKTLHRRGLVDTAHLGFSATLELRGQADVEDDIAAADAQGILDFLQHEGLISGEPATPLRHERIQVYPLEGVSHLKAPGTGIVAWKKRIGEAVTRGELIAEIVALDLAPGAARQAVTSDVDGILVARHHIKLARSGQKIGMLAGTTPLPGRQTGKLMGI